MELLNAGVAQHLVRDATVKQVNVFDAQVGMEFPDVDVRNVRLDSSAMAQHHANSAQVEVVESSVVNAMQQMGCARCVQLGMS